MGPYIIILGKAYDWVPRKLTLVCIYDNHLGVICFFHMACVNGFYIYHMDPYPMLSMHTLHVEEVTMSLKIKFYTSNEKNPTVL